MKSSILEGQRDDQKLVCVCSGTSLSLYKEENLDTSTSLDEL